MIQVGRIQFHDRHDRIFARPLGPLSSARGSPAPMRYAPMRYGIPGVLIQGRYDVSGPLWSTSARTTSAGRSPISSCHGDSCRLVTVDLTEYVRLHRAVLYSALRGCRLCASRVPKENEEGHRDAKGGIRFGRKASEGSDQGKGKIAMTKIPAAEDPARQGPCAARRRPEPRARCLAAPPCRRRAR